MFKFSKSNIFSKCRILAVFSAPSLKLRQKLSAILPRFRFCLFVCVAFFIMPFASFLSFAPFLPFAPYAPQALHAGTPSWDFVEDLDLGKDEVYETSFTIEGMQKDLRLYWTLYKNYGLVVNLKYDKFPYQFVLYTDYKRKSFKIPLSKGGDIDKDAYALVSFREFDDKAKRASLGLFVMLPKAPSGGN